MLSGLTNIFYTFFSTGFPHSFMKVEFLVENIENLLPALIRFIPTHSQIPALSNILIEAKKEGLFICATNLETGIIIKVPAKIEENGATTIPGDSKCFSERQSGGIS